MANILFFGTCSGTEPVEGMQHISFAIEHEGVYYWFDAGENCSRTAHLMGVDMLKVRAVFISHTHMDHVGGLGNLFWNIRKRAIMSGSQPLDKKIDLFIPNLETWDGISLVLKNTEGGFSTDFDILVHKTIDGVIYTRNDIRVTAFHNHHLQEDAHAGGWLSYSYRIEIEGKKIVYSGDVRDVFDLTESIGDGCDYLLMETGHHKIETVCAFVNSRNIKNLFFIHHGREIINHPDVVLQKTENLKSGVLVCRDKMTVPI
jgi:ribonuclease BN (tRNA processing enzyme)